ncbi:STAS domain-containing protein [uncultured Sulfitobacter sp.]|uniref:STAS domain-containing protein n=1 Tax=uncultured Sulfitobacter sp. TaxID=191468 RepID=UPI00262EF809|nr:STAS domain-containing protein [uncultured Sulfitobacter sp.]
MIHTTQHDPDVTVVRPGIERLTAANATDFKSELVALVEAGHSQIIIDFATVSFLDSSGLGALVGVLKKIGHRGDLLVCGLNGDVDQMFRVCRMDRVFPIHRDVDAALQMLRERQ